jgi:hypothetical protein
MYFKQDFHFLNIILLPRQTRLRCNGVIGDVLIADKWDYLGLTNINESRLRTGIM